MAGTALQSLPFVPEEGLGHVVVGADGYQGLAVSSSRGRSLQSPPPVPGFLSVPLWPRFPAQKPRLDTLSGLFRTLWARHSAQPLPKGVTLGFGQKLSMSPPLPTSRWCYQTLHVPL